MQSLMNDPFNKHSGSLLVSLNIYKNAQINI